MKGSRVTYFLAICYSLILTMIYGCDLGLNQAGPSKKHGGDSFREANATTTVVAETPADPSTDDQIDSSSDEDTSTIIMDQIEALQGRIDRSDQGIGRAEKFRGQLLVQRTNTQIDYAKAGILAPGQVNGRQVRETRDALTLTLDRINTEIIDYENQILELQATMRAQEEELEQLVLKIPVTYEAKLDPKVIRQQVTVVNRQIDRTEGIISRNDDIRGQLVNARTSTEIEYAKTNLLEASNDALIGVPKLDYSQTQKDIALAEFEKSLALQNTDLTYMDERIRTYESTLRSLEVRLDELTLKLEKDPK